MKKLLIGSFVGIGLTMTLAFSTMNFELRKESAKAEQMEGIYIFTDSEPLSEYEYLGTIKASVGWSGQYQSVRNKLIKKSKKDFPNAEGLIFHFKAGGTDRCDAIKFK